MGWDVGRLGKGGRGKEKAWEERDRALVANYQATHAASLPGRHALKLIRKHARRHAGRPSLVHRLREKMGSSHVSKVPSKHTTGCSILRWSPGARVGHPTHLILELEEMQRGSPHGGVIPP